MLLQPKLNLKVSQRQVLTPGLVQMVSVLALNKLELRDMINAEMIENPVLEELEDTDASIEERSGLEADRERSIEEVAADKVREEKDPFDEIDFGSYFQDYLDPGYKTASSFEDEDRPSFEHFLSQPGTLTDHLLWQFGSLTLSPEVRAAADLIIGNLDTNGYLVATDEELALQLAEALHTPPRPEPIPFDRAKARIEHADINAVLENIAATEHQPTPGYTFALRCVIQARQHMQQLDPIGVGARDLRECLLIQITAQRREAAIVMARCNAQNTAADLTDTQPEEDYAAPQQEHAAHLPRPEDVFETAAHIVAHCLSLLQKKDMRELTRSCARTPEQVQSAVDFIRTLDPRPGQRYNLSETRLIEPDVAFVKRDDQYVVLMNDEDMPTLRLNQGYRRMLRQKQTEKEVRDYVKERYKSAIQLLRNIEQRKNTIVRTCEAIVRRQADFLERGEQSLKPMMIKDVAEEIGVHPSTVSRAVANKYVHTAQGVYELRFFFSEGVNGPEGGDLPLVLLKRKVKKLIEEEDPRKPLTDDHLAAELKAQGINVTRRTVAKYREDMQIPSTHQRRVR